MDLNTFGIRGLMAGPYKLLKARLTKLPAEARIECFQWASFLV
jgi:hypothetical protein